MSTKDPLLNVVFQDKFRQDSAAHVLSRLQGLRDRARLLTVYSEHSAVQRVTSVMEVDTKTSAIQIDGFDGCCPDSGRSPLFWLLGRDNGVYVGLRGQVISKPGRSQDGLYSFDYEGCLWVMQRRGKFRVRIAPSARVVCELTLKTGQSLTIQLIDISEGGIGGVVLSDEFSPDNAPVATGDAIEQMRFTLPGDGLITAPGKIASVRPGARGVEPGWVIGIAFEGLSLPCEHRIGRFVRGREREQRRRERGL